MIKFWFNSLTINTLVGLNLMNWATQILSEKYVNIVVLKPYSDTAIQILIKDLIRPINIKILYFSIVWFFYMSKAILWCMHVAIWRPMHVISKPKGPAQTLLLSVNWDLNWSAFVLWPHMRKPSPHVPSPSTGCEFIILSFQTITKAHQTYFYRAFLSITI